MKRVRGVVWRLAVLGLVLVWALSGGPLVAVVQWALVGYVCWRAGPGVADDFSRLRGLVASRRGVREHGFRDNGANTL